MATTTLGDSGPRAAHFLEKKPVKKKDPVKKKIP
jgi:hypothetical protein